MQIVDEASEGNYKMSKPVAWMAKENVKNGLDDFFEHSQDFPDWQIEEFKESYIPLYTHPVKQLSDADILKIAENPDLWRNDGVLRSVIDFARAIIKEITE